MQNPLFDFRPPALTVSEVNAHIRKLIDTDSTLQDFRLEGEISNWSPAHSGHIYFTLKDSKSSLRCVIWRATAQRLTYRPQGEGEAIVAQGRVSVYEAGGAYQFYVNDIEPVGVGNLFAEFERLKRQLEAEGLFEAVLKKSLPPFPKRIGVVTSAKAAALQDILNVLARRFPLAEVVLSPTPVQGADAPPRIVAALAMLEAITPPIDVILMARGGGSIEDLWAFNDEAVARAVARCSIPIITGVGHETDFTIVDFVSDHRAPTPSAAAEVATPDAEELARYVAGYQYQFETILSQKLGQSRADMQGMTWQLEHLSPQNAIDGYRQKIDDSLATMLRMLKHRSQLRREQLLSAQARLSALSPQATLARGYAIVQKEGRVISSRADISTDDEISVTLADGTFEATVINEER